MNDLNLDIGIHGSSNISWSSSAFLLSAHSPSSASKHRSLSVDAVSLRKVNQMRRASRQYLIISRYSGASANRR